MTMSPITVRNDLLRMTDPSAPAPKPRRIKHTEIPATNRMLFKNTRSFRLAASSFDATPPDEKRERYTGRSGRIQGEKKETSPAASTVLMERKLGVMASPLS